MVKLTGVRQRFAPPRPRVVTPPKKALPFYQSAEWRSLMARLIALRGRQCQKCGATGCRIIGDHVVELRDGGAPLDAMNIELLCPPCHGKKTERRKRERAGLR